MRHRRLSLHVCPCAPVPDAGRGQLPQSLQDSINISYHAMSIEGSSNRLYENHGLKANRHKIMSPRSTTVERACSHPS